jgi:hypothetical protein
LIVFLLFVFVPIAASAARNFFCQFTTPATKAGFRFINAHGTFGGTTPAVDALP